MERTLLLVLNSTIAYLNPQLLQIFFHELVLLRTSLSLSPFDLPFVWDFSEPDLSFTLPRLVSSLSPIRPWNTILISLTARAAILSVKPASILHCRLLLYSQIPRFVRIMFAKGFPLVFFPARTVASFSARKSVWLLRKLREKKGKNPRKPIISYLMTLASLQKLCDKLYAYRLIL